MPWGGSKGTLRGLGGPAIATASWSQHSGATSAPALGCLSGLGPTPTRELINAHQPATGPWQG